jgi:hypothetical protein
MNQYFIFKGNRIYTDTREQIAPSGRAFRLSGVKIDATKAPIFKNKMYLHNYSITYRYIGTDEFFGFYFDANDKLIYKLNDDQVKTQHD